MAMLETMIFMCMPTSHRRTPHREPPKIAKLIPLISKPLGRPVQVSRPIR